MTVAIASGKGGTGKTTVAVSLALAYGAPVQLVDGDVEAPNAGLFLAGRLCERRTVHRLIPQVDASRCDGCGACAEHCRFGAIAVPGDQALVFSELCHACGGCVAHCPTGALSEVADRLGEVSVLDCGPVTLIEGRLDVGRPTAPPVVAAARAAADPARPVILDAPPGTACPAVAALREADYAVLVTEPTPFGLHDLMLAVSLVRKLDVPHGVVINRAGGGDARVADWCAAERLPVLLELPDDRRVAEAYARGQVLVQALPEYAEPLARLAWQLLAGSAQVHS